VPRDSTELQVIFKKLGFKNKEIITGVLFKYCNITKKKQLKYLDISKRKGLLEWQIMSIRIT